MIKTIQIDVSYIVCHEATHLQRVDLVKQILLSDMTQKESVKVMKEILEDFRESEQEFEKRPFMIEAYDTLINNH